MKKSVFINPFVDRGFKILFGQESSKELLIELINDLLPVRIIFMSGHCIIFAV